VRSFGSGLGRGCRGLVNSLPAFPASSPFFFFSGAWLPLAPAGGLRAANGTFPGRGWHHIARVRRGRRRSNCLLRKILHPAQNAGVDPAAPRRRAIPEISTSARGTGSRNFSLGKNYFFARSNRAGSLGAASVFLRGVLSPSAPESTPEVDRWARGSTHVSGRRGADRAGLERYGTKRCGVSLAGVLLSAEAGCADPSLLAFGRSLLCDHRRGRSPSFGARRLSHPVIVEGGLTGIAQPGARANSLLWSIRARRGIFR